MAPRPLESPIILSQRRKHQPIQIKKQAIKHYWKKMVTKKTVVFMVSFPMITKKEKLTATPKIRFPNIMKCPEDTQKRTQRNLSTNRWCEGRRVLNTGNIF